MFNRHSFGTVKFNISSVDGKASGGVSLLLSAVGNSNLMVNAPPAMVNFGFSTVGTEILRIFSPLSAADLNTDSFGESIRKLYSEISESQLRIDIDGEVPLTRIYTSDTKTFLLLDIAGQYLRRISFPESSIDARLFAAGQPIGRLYTVSSFAQLLCELQGLPTSRFYAVSPSILLNLGLKGSAAMFGYSVIELPNLKVPPDGDLVIDTAEMTVTLNGQDVTGYFGMDSEFFKFRPGENIVIFEDGVQNRNVLYKILWKDLWL